MLVVRLVVAVCCYCFAVVVVVVVADVCAVVGSDDLIRMLLNVAGAAPETHDDAVLLRCW